MKLPQAIAPLLIAIILTFCSSNVTYAQSIRDETAEIGSNNEEFVRAVNDVLTVVRNCGGESSCIIASSGDVPEGALPLITAFSQANSPDKALKFANVLGNCEASLSCVAQTAGIVPRDAATVVKIFRHCGGDAMCVAESSGMIPQEAMVAVNIVSNCGSDLTCVALATGLVPKNSAHVVNTIVQCGSEPTCMATSLGFVPKQGVIIANIIGRCGGDAICIAGASGLVPRDGAIVAQIVSECGGDPACIAARWGTVELQRCSRGIGVSGGCFGPNGEIMKRVDQILPQPLHPDVIIKNAAHDLAHGPGKNNEVRKLARRLFGRR